MINFVDKAIEHIESYQFLERFDQLCKTYDATHTLVDFIEEDDYCVILCYNCAIDTKTYNQITDKIKQLIANCFIAFSANEHCKPDMDYKIAIYYWILIQTTKLNPVEIASLVISQIEDLIMKKSSIFKLRISYVFVQFAFLKSLEELSTENFIDAIPQPLE